MKNPQNYKQEAVEKIVDFFKSEQLIAKICIPTGFGKTYILALAIKTLLNEKSAIAIAIFTDKREICEQFENAFVQLECDVEIVKSTNNDIKRKIYISTYQNLNNSSVDLSVFDLVICDNIHPSSAFPEEKFCSCDNVKILGVTNTPEFTNSMFDTVQSIFSYTISQAIQNGDAPTTYTEYYVLDFLKTLLENVGWQNIKLESKKQIRESTFTIDMVAKKMRKKYCLKLNHIGVDIIRRL